MAQQLKSERQIQSEILSSLISQLGLNDINAGSVLDVLTQSISQQHFSLYYQIAQLSRLRNIDQLFGQDLDDRAFEYGLERSQATNSKGIISILRPSSFVKVSTTFYAGAAPPISNDLEINVNDASSLLIGTSGTLVLGRGTNNEEEVSYSTPPINNTTFWTFVLNSPLTKDHAIEETVILKQGNDEIILAGTVVVVPASGVSTEISFTIDNDTTLLSGEDKITGVEVTASEPGSDSNIPIGAIDGEDAFSSSPFVGARARNEVKFNTGEDRETDDELRDRITDYIQGISKAVKEAILNAIVGAVDAETAKRVVSASIVLPLEEAGAVKIYLDDGSGFEPSFDDIGFESVLTESTGGEQRLQVDQFPIVKAMLESNSEEPFDFSTGIKTLEYEVGTTFESIQLSPGDFRLPDIATAEEVVAAINDKSTLLEARTSQIGRRVVITAKREVNENLQITGGNANDILNFPLDRKETIGLYVDDVKLSKDGESATLDSLNLAPYNLLAIGAYPHTLELRIDGKTANSQIATVDTSDVDDLSSVTAQEICDVINRDIAGITANPINSNTKIRIESLTKLSAKSKLEVLSGTLNDITNGLNLPSTEVVGVNGDYIFNRELGLIELTNPLLINQNVTLNSLFTRAKLRAGNSELYSPANGTTLVIEVDGSGDQTITFDGTFAGGKTAQQTADYINQFLIGGTGVVRTVGGINFLEVRTNSYLTSGSIIIKPSSTANPSFSFILNELAQSSSPNKAFLVSQEASPYDFAEGDSLVTVVDDDIVNNTYNIMMNYAEALTMVTSTSVFRSLPLVQVFTSQDVLSDFYIAFTSGPNTLPVTVTQVSIQPMDIARYTILPVPPAFTGYAIGDLFKVSDLLDSENNVAGVITGVGADWVEIYNPDAIATTGETGSGILSERRLVQSYNNLTGEIMVMTPFTVLPVVTNSFILIPSTATNLVNYINNTKITSFSLKGIVESVNGGINLQLSSKQNGSDGFIQVTGGRANIQLSFTTTLYRGLQAYNYWTGLTKLVHSIVYGNDSDLNTYPGVGAAGITFRILAPTIKQFGIELDVTLQEGITLSSIENSIKSVITAYVNTLGVGEDVIIERIRSAVINVPGVRDVVINTPNANIAIADNEKAFVADPEILIG